MPKPFKEKLSTFRKAFGPGIVTGAADDDPSGIATYTMVGAQFGNALLWTSAYTWPLMFAVQMMCARIGMVMGEGLSAALRTKFPRIIVFLLSVGLLIANTINVAADLAGMADAAELLSGLNAQWWVGVFAFGICYATVRFSYDKIETVLKWLVLVLFAYVGTAWLVHPPPQTIIKASFIPHWPTSAGELEALVAILGTTISPYLFFWQSSQEVEEEESKGRLTRKQREGASKMELFERAADVGVGTFFSNIVSFCIILAASSTLFAHGINNVSSSREAALALQPIAGSLATTLYTMGVLGLGFLAIPTLTVSAAYALADTFDWPEGLDRKLYEARSFYIVIIVSTVAAVLMNWAEINPFLLLFYSAVLNGIVAPFLMVAILFVATDKKLMLGQPSPVIERLFVGIATLLMFGVLIALVLV